VFSLMWPWLAVVALVALVGGVIVLAHRSQP
jgi:hypothetical protein